MDMDTRGAKRGGAWEQCSQKEMDRIEHSRRIWDKSTACDIIFIKYVFQNENKFVNMKISPKEKK